MGRNRVFKILRTANNIVTKKPSPSEFELDAFVEVYRMAHELSHSHGWNGHNYAAKLAAASLKDGETEEHKFWKRVEAALTPRHPST